MKVELKCSMCDSDNIAIYTYEAKGKSEVSKYNEGELVVLKSKESEPILYIAGLRCDTCGMLFGINSLKKIATIWCGIVDEKRVMKLYKELMKLDIGKKPIT